MSKNITSEKKRVDAGKQLSINFSIKDERFPKLLGLLCLFISFYLFIAFTSYLFTWDEDFDKARWAMLFNSQYEMSNWLGRLGAIVSNSFFYNGFGISSYIFVVLTFITGMNLVTGAQLIKLIPFFRKGLLAVLWTSILAAFIFQYSRFSWGGAFGQYVIQLLNAMVGTAGILVILLFSLVGVIVWSKNPNFNEWTTAKIIDSIKPKSLWLGFNQMISGWMAGKSPEVELANEKRDGTSNELVKVKEPKVVKEPVNAESETEKNENKGKENKGIQTLRPRNKETIESDFVVNEISDEEYEDEDNEHKNKALTLSTDKTNKDDLEKRLNKLTQNQLQLNLEGKEDEEEADSEFDEDHELEMIEGEKELPIVISTDKDLHDDLRILEENPDHSEPYDPTLELPRYQNPILDLLDNYDDNKQVVDRAELEANKDQIIETLLNYKIEIIQIKATIGPTVTLYEIVPAPGVRISKIKSLEDDIALSLAALGIRIIAPIPGKGTIGIEVPNRNKQMVSLKEVLASPKFKNAKMDLPIALGKTISNEVFVADLAKMPHLLIAGATGQGKSVGINTVIMSLLYKKHPSQLKLILIDPKKVELSPYNEIAAHYLAYLPDAEEAIVTETSKVVQTLYSLTVEMDDRYNLLKKAGVRHITEYNEKFVNRKLNPEKGHRFLPFMVLIIDEFADLIMTAGKEVELPIGRLAQLARAVGIHLIIATQRPSVNIITGVIKANFPARLAFKVASRIDSRTILDAGGAEQLIGRGDMLLSSGGSLLRIQCAFVDTPEVERVIEHIANQPGYPQPYFLPSYGDDDNDGGSSGDKLNQVLQDMDEFFEDSARLVVLNQSGSTSMIQRRLKLGYNRAGRIMDQLEYAGIVGPNEGSKARNVLFQDEIELEEYLKILRDKKSKMTYK